MRARKAILGSLGAIAVLLLSQLAAELVGSFFVMLQCPLGIANTIAGVLYCLLSYFLLKLFAKRLLKTDMDALGIPRFSVKKKWLVAAIALPLSVSAVFLLLPGEFVRSNMNGDQIFSTLSAGVIFIGLAAGFVEEMVFRGFILRLLEARWNRCVAVVAPSVLFGLLHIIGTPYSFLSCCLVLAAGTAVGVMFSLIALESNSVWNSAIVHAIWNIVIVGGGLTIGETANERSVMTYVLQTKNFAITGGEFGIESSVVALAGYALVSILAIVMMQKRQPR